MQRPRPLRRRARGFTIVELMITVAIAGILAAVAMPGYSSFMAQTRLSQSAAGLTDAMRYARSEAARSNAVVLVNAGSGGWGAGWSAQTLASATLRSWPAPRGSQSFSASATSIGFYPDGSLFLSSGTAATIKVCSGSGGPSGRLLSVNGAGFMTSGPTSPSYQPCP